MSQQLRAAAPLPDGHRVGHGSSLGNSAALGVLRDLAVQRGSHVNFLKTSRFVNPVNPGRLGSQHLWRPPLLPPVSWSLRHQRSVGESAQEDGANSNLFKAGVTPRNTLNPKP